MIFFTIVIDGKEPTQEGILTRLDSTRLISVMLNTQQLFALLFAEGFVVTNDIYQACQVQVSEVS